MKRILLFLMITCTVSVAMAQTYGNEWINYSQQYFKFKVIRDSIYRITASDLFALGMPNSVQGANLQVFRDGVEQTIFVSTNGTLSPTDFIEFYAYRADGKVNAPLYKNPQHQSNPYVNILSDTSFYFVTYNNSTTNKRYSLRSNTIVNPPIKETYFWDRTRATYRNSFNGGTSYFGSGQTPVIFMPSSQFEDGEGYAKSFTASNDSITVSMSNPYVLAGGPSGTLRTIVLGNSYLSLHRLKLFANNNEIADSTFGAFSSKQFVVSVPMTYTSPGNRIVFKYTPMNNGIPNLPDRYGISYFEFRFPRLFNFGNRSHHYFELDPKLTDYYLEITNFNHGGLQPILYDMTSNEYLQGDISVPGQVRFLIPASQTTKQLVLHSRATGSGVVQDLQPVNFKNYSLSSNQGDYIIITHKNLMSDGINNYVDEYKDYRSSLSGGGYQAIAVDVQDIYNEFGYGYTFDAQSIKNFLHYASKNASWSVKPKHVLLIGKGITYLRYLAYSTAPFSTYPFYAIPTFGHPASDILLTDFDMNNKPQLSIGRVPAMTANEVKLYLDKVKAHEQVVRNVSLNSDDMLWRKKVIHIAGASDAQQQAPIVFSLSKQETLLKNSLYGAQTVTIKKGTTSAVEDVNSKVIDDLINDGVGLIQFFGHSSSSGMDYNLDFPENYKNMNRYPSFIANGCGAGNMFELTGQKSLGERFVMAPNSGSINFIASVGTGLTNNLATYTDSLYGQFGVHNYGVPVGEQIRSNVFGLMSRPSFANDNLLRLHTEQIVLDGDPATPLYFTEKPDYSIEEKGLRFSSLNLTSSVDSFDVEVVVLNLGKHTKDSVSLFIKRILPNNVEQVLVNKQYAGIAFGDTMRIKVPTMGEFGLGVNYIEVDIDVENRIDELSESNNQLRRQFVIYNDDLVPVYPYNFAIVNKQGLTLKGSTLNPFVGERSYVMQLDTTEKFDSPRLLTNRITSSGGVIKWQPTITFQDSVVYYWRSAMDTLYGNKEHRWTSSSFVFLSQIAEGWNQSHYFQWNKNAYNNMQIDSASRRFQFASLNKKLQVQNVCMNAPAPYTYTFPDYLVKINGSTLYTFGCDPFPGYSSVQFMVLDTLNGQPWLNTKHPSLNQGRFGSYAPCRINVGGVFVDPFFEFDFRTTAFRENIMNFLDSIPQGYYVMMQPRLCVGAGNNACGTINTVFINQWKSDTNVWGAGNSLYHKLYNFGFTLIDSFYKNRPMVFFMQKGKPNTVQQFVEADSTKKLYAEFDFKSSLYEGTMASPKIGPAKVWSHFYTKGVSTENPSADSTVYDIIGADLAGSETLLARVMGDTSLSFVDAVQYPYIRLQVFTSDNDFNTPTQFKYWRVHYEPVPEAALNPNRLFTFKDTIGQGQKLNVAVAIENLTEYPMDSMLVKYHLIDKGNNKITLATKRYKQLPILDTIHVTADLDISNYSGRNTLVIEANPDNDQPEQYHPNNIGYKELYIVADKKNPLLDVTFDGIHIMDRDIVSAKPVIQITLKDENRFLALDDTSLVSVYMKYPGENSTSETYIPFDNQILKFFPATTNDAASGKNMARIEFRPTFTVDGNDYMLIVRAKDKTGNSTGNNAYRVAFRVVTKPSISSVVNYPNPFTTSTQFVFTITGSEVPSNLKIQILTPTGKVVREITKAELGNLHVGRNITEFRWKGDDQFGQPLGNGVYLYRVVSNLNGKKMDHFDSGADKWIENGFGKMYLMR